MSLLFPLPIDGVDLTENLKGKASKVVTVVPLLSCVEQRWLKKKKVHLFSLREGVETAEAATAACDEGAAERAASSVGCGSGSCLHMVKEKGRGRKKRQSGLVRVTKGIRKGLLEKSGIDACRAIHGIYAKCHFFTLMHLLSGFIFNIYQFKNWEIVIGESNFSRFFFYFF